MMTAIASSDLQRLVQLGAAALARGGLVHAYGHCSARIDATHFLVCAAGPMGLVGDRPGVVCAVERALPDGVLGEVRAHQQIYRRRPEVGGVCRIMPPALMALSTLKITPRPRHGIGAFFGGALPLWDDPALLRSDDKADGLAAALGDRPAIVMRGNGAITVGETLPEAVALAWFLEDAARIEERVRTIGADPESGLLTAPEIAARQGFAGGVVERMWSYLTEPNRIGAFDGGR
jgi:HCOMODA/2-hydroxy-3-carboxy-muconic semialdehyde decarboxylase